MMPVNSCFFEDVQSFASNNKVPCILAIGLVALYSSGNLGRAVSWISECIGTTNKAYIIAHERLQKSIARDLEVYKKTVNIIKLLKAYNSLNSGWVMVPPKDQIKIDEAFIVGSGGIGYEGNGRWKIHVSIDPHQMEEAIPIVLDVLHGPNAPRAGFKVQTKINLDSPHQIGKEFAIIFDEKVEKAALTGNREVEKCLSLLWNKLYSAGICTEQGYVLTPETRGLIQQMGEGTQVFEKQNLNSGKFDRVICSPKDNHYFHYRDENCVIVQDNQIRDLEGELGVYAASYLIALAENEPDFAHNPTRSPDPFVDLKLTQT